MRVEVRLLQELYFEAGRRHRLIVELPEDATVSDLLSRLPEAVRKRVLEAPGRLRWPAVVLVNGRRIDFLEGLETRLHDGDVVVVSPRALFVV